MATQSAPTSTRPTAPADVYPLSKVLNNWPARETSAILTRCAEAGRPSGVVLAVGGAAPDAPLALTIEMVRPGRNDRPPAQLRRRCATVGLDVTAAGPDRRVGSSSSAAVKKRDRARPGWISGEAER